MALNDIPFPRSRPLVLDLYSDIVEALQTEAARGWHEWTPEAVASYVAVVLTDRAHARSAEQENRRDDA